MLFGFKEKARMKKYVNKCIDTINKNIYDDELWKGRFVVSVSKLSFRRYEDWSGYAAILRINMLDKQTGFNKDEFVHYSSICLQSYIFEKLNDFIIKDVDVWKEKPTRKNTIDYRGK